jgi:membrane-associated phospholipid phosphatase
LADSLAIAFAPPPASLTAAQSPGVQGSASRQRLVKSLTVVNEQPLTLGALATYGIGRLVGSSTIADVGLHTTEALVLRVAVSEAVRGPVGRARPHISPNDPYNFTFWAGFTDFAKRSYPSLHAAVAFATASALTGEIHERDPSADRWAAPLLYTAALIPGFTRVYLDQHWASDVFSGAVVGTLLGAKVVRYAHTHKRNRLDRWLLGATVAPAADGGVMVDESFTP